MVDHKQLHSHHKIICGYAYNIPQKVFATRTLLQVAAIGTSYLPVSGQIKDAARKFMKSFYESQRITDGALYGAFKRLGNEEAAKWVLKAHYGITAP